MLSLAAKKVSKTDFLLRHSIIERMDSDLLSKVHNSKDLLLTKIKDNIYDNEKVQVNLYKRLYKNVDGGCSVTFLKPKETDYGRCYPQRSLGCCSLRKPVRHTLCDDMHIDFDLCNAQPAILMSILSAHNLPIPDSLNYYVLYRENVIDEFREMLNVERKHIKELFIRIFFSGTYEGWTHAMEEEGYRIKDLFQTGPKFIYDLTKDLKEVTGTLETYNPELWRSVRRKTPGDGDISGTCMGLLLQSYEYAIIDNVLEELDTNTKLLRGLTPAKRYVLYEFDGIKIQKSNVERFGGKDKVLEHMNGILQRLGLKFLRFETKPMDSRISLDPSDSVMVVKEIEEIQRSHRYAAQKVKELRPDWYFYELPTKEWYCYDDAENSWMNNDHFLGLHYPTVLGEYVKSKIDSSNKEQTEKYRQLTISLGTAGYQTSFMKWAKSIFSVRKVHFDTNPYLLNCENGVVDFQTMTFRERRRDDYVTMSIGYPLRAYEIGDENGNKTGTDSGHESELLSIFSLIWPDPQIRELSLIILASGLLGINTENFFVFNGDGRNGKGLVHNFQQLALGDYCLKVSNAILTESSKFKKSNEANGTLSEIDKVRYLYTVEPARNIPIQNANIKELTGEVSIRARKNYGENKDIFIHCSLVCECNAVPVLAEQATNADRDRIRDVPFVSTFTQQESRWDESKHIYPMEPKFKERKYLLERRNAYMNILLSYARKLRDKDYKIEKFVPDVIRERSDLYCNESIVCFSIFRQLFVYDENSKVPDSTLKQIVDTIYASDQWYLQPTSVKRLKENGKEAMKNFFATAPYFEPYYYEKDRQKFLRNFRRKPDEDEQTITNESNFDLISEVSTEDFLNA